MLIISWNVAGLNPLTEKIHSSYLPTTDHQEVVSNDDTSASANKKRRKLPPSAALHSFITRHGADILCLQEHKIPREQLSSRTEPRGCSTVEDFESFWSCCVNKTKKGFNGVVTYAKKGTVSAADIAPLGSEDLDSQGRCVMTDHGKFSLFNVYVPASSGQPLSYKMKFLNALRRSMQRQREIKPVVLVGDLNITHEAIDKYWSDRVIHVQDILKQQMTAQEDDENGTAIQMEQWKQDLVQAWPKISAALETKEVIARQTTNTVTGEKFDKFRLAVTVDGKRIFLGRHESSEAHCHHWYDLDAWSYLDEVTGEERLAGEADVLTLSVLAELMEKIAGVKWDDDTLRSISQSDDAGVSRVYPPRQWLRAVIEGDGMVDTFRHFHPSAEGRFTCWHQYKNKRYTNEGSRIDYILVDKELLEHAQQGPGLRCGNSEHAPQTEAAAHDAATACGGFRAVSFGGEGIQDVPQMVLDTQFGAPHTGIVYTPPSFSDHVGVSLLLEDPACPTDIVLNEQDEKTRKAQPHKAQKTIASFFAAGATSSATATATATAASRTRPLLSKATAPVEKKSAKSFFAPRSQNGDSSTSRSSAMSLSSTTTSSISRKVGTSTAFARKPKAQTKNILHHFHRK